MPLGEEDCKPVEQVDCVPAFPHFIFGVQQIVDFVCLFV